MKPRNREIYNNLPKPSEDFRVVSRERLPQKPGYQISFIDITNGLLRPRVYDCHKGFLSFPEWALMHSTFPKEEQGVELLYASEEGIALIEQVGYSWFRDDIFAPEQWGGEKIGEGSESMVYKATLAGKNCVIKYVNTAGIEKLNKFAWRAHYNPPEYLKKFMVTPQVSKIIATVQKDNAFDSFMIVDSPLEYVASKYFTIEEYMEGSTLKDIKNQVRLAAQPFINSKERGCWGVGGNYFTIEEYLEGGILKYFKDQVRLAAEPVINGKEWEFWVDWFPLFKKDQNSLEELFFLAGLEREEPFREADFYNSNWIFKGFSPAGKVQLSLLDQASAGVAHDMSMYTFLEQEKKNRQKELLQKWHNSPLLELLRQYKL